MKTLFKMFFACMFILANKSVPVRAINISPEEFESSLSQEIFSNNLSSVQHILDQIPSENINEYLNRIDMQGDNIYLDLALLRHETILPLLEAGAAPTKNNLSRIILCSFSDHDFLKPFVFYPTLELIAARKRLAPSERAFQYEVNQICSSMDNRDSLCFINHSIGYLGYHFENSVEFQKELIAFFKILRYLKDHGVHFDLEALKTWSQKFWKNEYYKNVSENLKGTIQNCTEEYIETGIIPSGMENVSLEEDIEDAEIRQRNGNYQETKYSWPPLVH